MLEETDDINDIERLIRWPDLSDPRWTAGLRERAQGLREGSEYFVVMRMAASHGPFQTACDLRGTENFLMDMALNPDFATALLDPHHHGNGKIIPPDDANQRHLF